MEFIGTSLNGPQIMVPASENLEIYFAIQKGVPDRLTNCQIQRLSSTLAVLHPAGAFWGSGLSLRTR